MTTRSTRSARRRGTILILTMTVCFALAAVVLVLARKMSVEAIAAANQVGAIQADGVERGAEQYVMSLFNSAVANGSETFSVMDPTIYTEDMFAGIPVGADPNSPSGWFWIVRPQYEEDDLPLYGLVDESSKFDLNHFGLTTTSTATAVPSLTTVYNGLMMLPGMQDDIANSIIDWRDTDQDPSNGTGMEGQYYLTLSDPYYAKDQPYENVEELLMVYGITGSYLYGDGTASPLGEPSGGITNNAGMNGDPLLSRGIYDLLTTHAFSPPAAGGGGGGGAATGTLSGLVNVNTAPRIVLQALLNSATQPQDYNLADTIIAQRTQNGINGGTNDISWFQTALGSNALQTRITGQSLFYSADIVAVSHNGRGYKRVRIIVDTTTTPVSIVYRRDMTDKGWPMERGVLDWIRKEGTLPGNGVGGYGNTLGGTLR